MLLIVYYIVFLLGGSLSSYLAGLIVERAFGSYARFSILVDLLAACGLDDPTKIRGARCTALAWANRCGKSRPVGSTAAGRGRRCLRPNRGDVASAQKIWSAPERLAGHCGRHYLLTDPRKFDIL